MANKSNKSLAENLMQLGKGLMAFALFFAFLAIIVILL